MHTMANLAISTKSCQGIDDDEFGEITDLPNCLNLMNYTILVNLANLANMMILAKCCQNVSYANTEVTNRFIAFCPGIWPFEHQAVACNSTPPFTLTLIFPSHIEAARLNSYPHHSVDIFHFFNPNENIPRKCSPAHVPNTNFCIFEALTNKSHTQ